MKTRPTRVYWCVFVFQPTDSEATDDTLTEDSEPESDLEAEIVESGKPLVQLKRKGVSSSSSRSSSSSTSSTNCFPVVNFTIEAFLYSLVLISFNALLSTCLYVLPPPLCKVNIIFRLERYSVAVTLAVCPGCECAQYLCNA